MIKGKYYLIILGIIILAAIILRIASLFNDRPVENLETVEQAESFILEGQPLKELVTTTTPATKIESSPDVIIDFPQANDIISSPLIVSGKARGSWFFEASLPVKLTDEAGNTLAIVTATAQADWMTSDLVPFRALVEFKSTSTSGYLIIAKDNPSGLVENDDSIRQAVRFLTK